MIPLRATPKALQTTQGKAFEYACLKALADMVTTHRPLYIKDNSSLKVAYEDWNQQGDELQRNMHCAAAAGVKTIVELEPTLIESSTEELEVRMQDDRQGIAGDVRDLVISNLKTGWEMGISIKHNHDATKHSRLSRTIDFGDIWLELPCSRHYFDTITPLFEALDNLKQRGILWSELPDKIGDFYEPLLQAFQTEMTRLDATNPGEVPGRLLRYLIGRKDFYKLVSEPSKRMTKVTCYNLSGSLNKASRSGSPTLRSARVTLPTRIIEFNKVSGVRNTLVMVLDNGWTIKFRIHNAKTEVEPSLKFDISLTGVPAGLFNSNVSW